MKGDRHIKKEIYLCDAPDRREGLDLFLFVAETIEGVSSREFTVQGSKEVDYIEGEDSKPLINLRKTECQQLIDELYKKGFRPTENQFTAEQIKALSYHLEDMRKIVFNGIDWKKGSEVL